MATPSRIKMNEPDDALIVKRTDYFNQYGMHIEHRELYYVAPGSKLADKHVEFVGHGAIPAKDENDEDDPIPFEFAIAATSLQEAFTKFRVACNLKGEQIVNDIKAEQKKMADEAPRIITQ